ncbi:transcription factor TFIIIB subunit brf1 [Phlyctochytrium planicorne]|nr:transcription factor TFIIIB subunit brf1 [Phlyctochytrium planicorne]
MAAIPSVMSRLGTSIRTPKPTPSAASVAAGKTVCKCGSSNIEYEASMGHSVCMDCAEVLEENAIVAEATFTETSKGASVADGVRVNLDSAWASTRGGAMGSVRLNNQESREITIQNGHRRIAQIGNQMRMSDRQIEGAQRYFNLAVLQNFTKGRKANNVAAACLYIVCRLERTSHMLIDFAEHLRINVFSIGSTFVRLVATLQLEDLPLVEPMLFIARFASKLEFDDRYQDVVRDASRLVSRMDRDWIVRGRRPSGICGACLYIAARMNGFKRSTRELVRVMKICETTLRKRLTDFKNTPSSALTVDDFQTVFLEEGADPPSFVHSRKAASAIEGSVMLAITDGTESAPKRKRLEGDDDDNDNDDDDIEENDNTRADEASFRDAIASEELGTLASYEGVSLDDNDDDLSYLDNDIEVRNSKLTDVEVEIKTQYWTEENADWIVRNAARKKAEEEGRVIKRKRRRKNGNNAAQELAEQEEKQAQVAAKKHMSKKLNYDIVSTLFPGANVVIPPASGSSSAPVAGSVTGFGSVPVGV